jgi:predicted O-methyltransferase YrrM
MANRRQEGRRAFLASGGVGVLAAAAHLQGALAAAGESALVPPTRDPVTLARLLAQMDAKGGRYWSVPRKDGELLHFLVKVARARSVLEIGTSHGYSALWMGLALEDTGGRLTTIEIDGERHALAIKHLGEAGLAARVTAIRADAHREVPRLAGPFDFVFLDADKEGQLDYFRTLYPKKLFPGAILAVHNAIRQAGAMRDYLDLVQKHPDFDSVTVSATMDDGFCLSRRRSSY